MSEAAERAPVGDLGVVVERLRRWVHRILARYRIPVQGAEDLVQPGLQDQGAGRETRQCGAAPRVVGSLHYRPPACRRRIAAMR
jgi:hypothetical protein